MCHHQPDRGRCRTLIVEDDATSRSALARLLSLCGHEVDTAATVAEARRHLCAGPPPCHLLLDLNLPDGAGTAILAAVRAMRLPVRVAVISAADDGELLSRARRLKPDAFFPKPVDVPPLCRWLEARDQHAAALPPVPSRPVPPGARPGEAAWRRHLESVYGESRTLCLQATELMGRVARQRNALSTHIAVSRQLVAALSQG